VRLGVAAAAVATVACAWDALPGAYASASGAHLAGASCASGGAAGAAAGARAAILYFLGPHAFFASVWVTLQARMRARARHAPRTHAGLAQQRWARHPPPAHAHPPP
jgi:hypothetical protein